MPVLDGAIQARFQRGVELVVLCSFLYVVAPIPRAKSRQPSCSYGFFRATTLRTITNNWIQLLLRIGSKVRISEPAAAMIAMTAMVVGSIEIWNLAEVYLY